MQNTRSPTLLFWESRSTSSASGNLFCLYKVSKDKKNPCRFESEIILFEIVTREKKIRLARSPFSKKLKAAQDKLTTH